MHFSTPSLRFARFQGSIGRLGELWNISLAHAESDLFPAALPSILQGLRIGLALGWVILAIAEFSFAEAPLRASVLRHLSPQSPAGEGGHVWCSDHGNRELRDRRALGDRPEIRHAVAKPRSAGQRGEPDRSAAL